MKTRDEANSDIIDKLLALASDHHGSVVDYFETLYLQLEERLRGRDMDDGERTLQLSRLRNSIDAALERLTPADDSAEPVEPLSEMIASPAADDQESNVADLRQGEILFSLSRLDELQATAENTVSFNTIEGGYEIRSTSAHAASGGRTGGVSIQLSSEIEAAASGRTVIVEVVAQTARNNGSSEMAIAYSTAGVGNSGWTTVDLGNEFDTFSIVYDVPEHQGAPHQDYIGLWADTSGNGKGAIIDSVTLRLVHGGQT